MRKGVNEMGLAGNFIHMLYTFMCFIVIVALPLGLGAFGLTHGTSKIMKHYGVSTKKIEALCTFMLFGFSTILFLLFVLIAGWL